VEPAAALAGVYIRAGLLTISGERVVSGLVQRLGSLDFIDKSTTSEHTSNYNIFSQ
jgi:hypothetical protein